MKTLSKNKMYYLASPYSYMSKKYGFIDTLIGYVVRSYRFRKVSDAAVHLIKHGYTCLEPIATCHYKSLRYDLPTGYTFWQKRDRWFIRKCDGIIVLTLPGWQESAGVTDEINYSRSRGIDVIYMNPKDFSLKLEKLPIKRRKTPNLTIVKNIEVK